MRLPTSPWSAGNLSRSVADHLQNPCDLWDRYEFWSRRVSDVAERLQCWRDWDFIKINVLDVKLFNKFPVYSPTDGILITTNWKDWNFSVTNNAQFTTRTIRKMHCHVQSVNYCTRRITFEYDHVAERRTHTHSNDGLYVHCISEIKSPKTKIILMLYKNLKLWFYVIFNNHFIIFKSKFLIFK